MAHSAFMAWRGTCAVDRARPGLARSLRRLLVAAGAGAACWLLGMLLASAAHASEAPEDTAENSDTGLLTSVGGELDALTGDQNQEAARGDSGLLGSVTSTTLGTVERAAGDLVDKAGDTAQAGLDDVTSPVSGKPPGEPTRETPESPAPASTTPAQRTTPTPSADPVQPRDQGYSGHEVSATTEAQTPSPADSAAEAQPAPAPAERTRGTGETGTSDETAPSTTSATGHTDPAPSTPALPSLPSVPSPPASPATGTAHVQDGSHSGKQPGALADAVAAAVRFEPVVAGGERATGDAGGIPARPGASPD